MEIIKVKVCNEQGIHARPSTKICNLTNKFDGTVHFKYMNKLYDAKNVMAIMLIGLEMGAEFEIIADGKDANKLLQSLKTLIEIEQFK